MGGFGTRLGVGLAALFCMAPVCHDTGRTGFENDVPAIAEFNFTPSPQGQSYDMVWHQGSANTLTAGMVERYEVQARLASPVSHELKVNLQVMVGSTQVGTIEATFASGKKTPTTLYRANAGAKHTPTGMTNLVNGQFWLACTTVKGAIRGNAGKSTAKSANVLLRVGADHTEKSTSHSVTCK